MAHPGRNPCVRQVLAIVGDRFAPFAVLYDFADDAVGVGHEIIQIANFALGCLLRNLYAFGLEVKAHRFGVVGLNGEMIHPWGAGLPLLEDLHILPVVDLEDGEVDAPVFPVKSEGILVAEEFPVEAAGVFIIAREEAGVRDAEDLRPDRIARAGNRRKQEREPKLLTESFHDGYC